jgi:hypothetical protein
MREKYPESQKVKTLTGDVLKVISRLKASGDDAFSPWDTDLTLKVVLEDLSNTLNQVKPKSMAAPTTPLGRAVKNLMETWGNSEVRSKPSNRKAYLNDLNHILQMTQTGKEVLDCYAKAKGPLISGEQIVDFPEEQKERGLAMAFQVNPDPAKPGKYIKTIYLNVEPSPISTLTSYAHELRHGCSSSRHAENRQKMKNPKQDLSKEFQDRALDEMRAYHTEVEFFKELAQSAPDLACNEYSTSAIFGTQVLSSSEYRATIDEMFQDGTFPRYLISKYAELELIPADAVHKSGPDGSQGKELSDDLIRSLNAEGFKVKK